MTQTWCSDPSLVDGLRVSFAQLLTKASYAGEQAILVGSV